MTSGCLDWGPFLVAYGSVSSICFGAAVTPSGHTQSGTKEKREGRFCALQLKGGPFRQGGEPVCVQDCPCPFHAGQTSLLSSSEDLSLGVPSVSPPYHKQGSDVLLS